METQGVRVLTYTNINRLCNEHHGPVKRWSYGSKYEYEHVFKSNARVMLELAREAAIEVGLKPLDGTFDYDRSTAFVVNWGGPNIESEIRIPDVPGVTIDINHSVQDFPGSVAVWLRDLLVLGGSKTIRGLETGIRDAIKRDAGTTIAFQHQVRADLVPAFQDVYDVFERQMQARERAVRIVEEEYVKEEDRILSELNRLGYVRGFAEDTYYLKDKNPDLYTVEVIPYSQRAVARLTRYFHKYDNGISDDRLRKITGGMVMIRPRIVERSHHSLENTDDRFFCHGHWPIEDMIIQGRIQDALSMAHFCADQAVSGKARIFSDWTRMQIAREREQAARQVARMAEEEGEEEGEPEEPMTVNLLDPDEVDVVWD